MQQPTVFDRNPALVKPGGRAAWAESFAPVLADLRAGLQARDPIQIARLSGVEWDAGRREFSFLLLDEAFRMPWADLVAYPKDGDQPCSSTLQGLFLYYLCIADGAPPAQRWVSFRELPEGWLYHQAFQGYTGNVLAHELDNNLCRFAAAAGAIGGREVELGDSGFEFQALPRIKLALVYWLGDDEFPPQAQMLFDAAAGNYLTIDGLAGLGSHLVHRLLRSAA
jgi:hypothetical protein